MAESIGVTPNPEINTVELTPDHAFFVVASDGVWEFLTSQDVVDIVSATPAALPAHGCVVRKPCDHVMFGGGATILSLAPLPTRGPPLLLRCTSACPISAAAEGAMLPQGSILTSSIPWRR